MKKMTKGAIVTGLGVALLLGGGGTLAVWNDSVKTDAGTIVSGDLNLEAVEGSAKWTTNVAGAPAIGEITDYRVVPGETLTFTQQLDIDLDGDHLDAMLTATGGKNNAQNPFLDKNIVVSQVTVTDAKGKDMKADKLTEADSGIVTAKTTFTFKEETDGRDSVNAKYDFGGVQYVLTQQPPALG
ncbi:alternate-type signal peptide domain-containing protein [Micrococcus sp. TA1]|uniref:alternate-type signal peptide domain-containing protein n=2 Tax=Micrococcaceae TaxID=1268 RepID=UPI0016093DF6|nr:alternate-type signal peptide domain-containing protein [Micrococcus sp. TA1]MBB5749540.1 alternate signal-mediated exported protein [Micrococcus sp. TA1]